jgi:chemotaxis protein CheZ
MKRAARSAEAAQPGTQDSAELEALFDSIAQAGRQEQATPADSAAQNPDKVISQIGQLTRKLHDTMRELGYDRVLQNAADAIPDTTERLAYVARMTEQAAVRALNAIETAKPIQERLGADAAALGRDWERVFSRELGVDEFKVLAERTRAYLAEVPRQTRAIDAQLTDIMMAQDFQDLTGQVIKKITGMAQEMEAQLLQLLVEHAPSERREAAQSLGLLDGPVIKGSGRADVVTDQGQVDELLESLGF